MIYEKMSGYEIMQSILREELPHPTMSETIPMKFLQVEKGKVIFNAIANEKHLNPQGGVHGGFAATVLDSVTGCAIHTLLGVGVAYGTIDLNVKMMRPVPKNTNLIAEGKVINISKSLGVSEGTLKSDDGKLYATSTATCLIINNKKNQ